ncbi:hypothetical protein [Curtobacterium sp. MCPF17_052]|uniref:hypothetical protein n=1 Tax=Curtobacterium sp. MCPF17_052 TaxID=2175655 RepID=UPI0034638F0F
MRVVPALGEHGEHVGDDRAAELHRRVVPRGAVAVPGVHRDRLRVALVPGVVPTAVAQVDAADVGDVARRVVPVLDDEELLVVRAEEPDALVEEDLTASVVDPPPEQLVRLRAERRRDPLTVGAPDEPADLHAGAGTVGEQVADGRAVRQQALIGVAAPVGEPDTVAGPQRRQLRLDAREVRRPVHQGGGRGCRRTTRGRHRCRRAPRSRCCRVRRG